jgi:membrane carboxypeptidase/penicillin-binding protein
MLAPHFVFWIKDLLSQKYGADMVENGGLKITTTLDLDLQAQAQQIMSEEVDKAEKLGISNGAALMLDPTNGQVLAMIGSRDYMSTKTDGNFNVVTQALRQPGSAIKPVTYLAAIKKGYTASSMVMDTPVTFPGTGGQPDYTPQNYNGKFNGPMSIRNALGNSINTVAVKTLANVGIKNMLQLAFDMGLSTLEPTKENLSRFGLAVTLGGAEVKMIDLASAYTAFANGGKTMAPIGILKVEDKNGRVLEQYKPDNGKTVMTPQEAFIISNILADNSAREMTFGVVNGLQISGYQVAVKTGTTNDKKDNWAIGWTPNLLTAVWVGNNNNTAMGKIASGVSGATPIWKRIMTYEVTKRPKQDFPIPDKIVSMDVDKISGYPAHDGFPSRPDYFIDGTQMTTADPIHLLLKVCKGQAGLATPEDVASNNFDSKEYFNFKENDVVSTDGVNRWQQGIDSWIAQQSNKDIYNPPTAFCHSGGLVSVAIDSPNNQSTVGSTFDVKISTTSLVKITEVKLWVDGVDTKTWADRPFETSLTLSDGPHNLRVKATDRDGNSQDGNINIGVNTSWNATPTPVLTITPTVKLTVTPTVTP